VVIVHRERCGEADVALRRLQSLLGATLSVGASELAQLPATTGLAQRLRAFAGVEVLSSTGQGGGRSSPAAPSLAPCATPRACEGQACSLAHLASVFVGASPARRPLAAVVGATPLVREMLRHACDAVLAPRHGLRCDFRAGFNQCDPDVTDLCVYEGERFSPGPNPNPTLTQPEPLPKPQSLP